MSRRELGGLVAASFVGAGASAHAATASADPLAASLRAERRAVRALRAALASGRLAPESEATARLILGHDERHLGRLSGRAPRPGSIAVPGLDATLRAGERAILRLLLRLEGQSVAAHADLAARSGDGGLRATATGMMASDAQHLVLLREALGQQPLRGAFEPPR